MVTVTGGSNTRVSLAALIAIKPGCRPRLIYRVHKNRRRRGKDKRKGLIGGWECSLSKETAFVERAIRQATALRARQGHPISGAAIHHSDAGSRYTSVRFAQTLLLAGLTGSVGSVGDAYDNALAETTIGLYKTECTRSGSPFRNGPIRTLADLEEITSAWVAWYNAERLMHRLGRRPPTEAEAGYWARQEHVA